MTKYILFSEPNPEVLNKIAKEVFIKSGTNLAYMPSDGANPKNAKYIGMWEDYAKENNGNLTGIKRICFTKSDWYTFGITSTTYCFDNGDKVDETLSGKYIITGVRHIIRFDKHETVIEVATDSTKKKS